MDCLNSAATNSLNDTLKPEAVLLGKTTLEVAFASVPLLSEQTHRALQTMWQKKKPCFSHTIPKRSASLFVFFCACVFYFLWFFFVFSFVFFFCFFLKHTGFWKMQQGRYVRSGAWERLFKWRVHEQLHAARMCAAHTTGTTWALCGRWGHAAMLQSSRDQ